MLIRLDLPTLLRPMKANSGRVSVGHCEMLADDVMKVVFKGLNELKSPIAPPYRRERRELRIINYELTSPLAAGAIVVAVV